MKAFALTLFSAAAMLSCTKTEKPQTSNPADYAETYDDLIQNKEKDSLRGDSINRSTNMPPQQKTTEVDPGTGQPK